MAAQAVIARAFMDPRPFPDPPLATSAPRQRASIGPRLIGAAGGAALVFGLHALAGAQPLERLNQLVRLDGFTLLAAPALLFVAVLAHEFGHLAGGWSAGMRPLLLVAGPLHVDFVPSGRPRVRRNRLRRSLRGFAVCVPAPQMGFAAQALTVAGGPSASLVLAAASAALALRIGGWWGGALLATAALSLLILLITLLPLRTGGMMSDGAQLLALARGDAGMRHRLAIAALLAQSYSGVRARDWNAGLFAAATAETSEPALRAVVHSLHVSRTRDQGRLGEADLHCRALAHLVADVAAGAIAPPVRGSFALGVATWLAEFRREPEASRRWFAASEVGIHDPTLVAFARAAIARSGQEYGRASVALEEACRHLPRLADRGAALSLSERIEALRSELAARPPAVGALDSTE